MLVLFYLCHINFYIITSIITLAKYWYWIVPAIGRYPEFKDSDWDSKLGMNQNAL